MVLNKLMLNCGGLGVLLNVVEDQSLFERSVKGLSVLAQKIGIKDPVPKIKKKIPFDERTLSKDTSKPVTFTMDDGSKVVCQRNILIHKSQYFER